MRLTLTACILLFSMTTYSQNEKVIVKFCPPALIDIVGFPTFQAGVEWKLSKRFSWYNEAGIELYHFPKSDTNFIGSGGFKFKTELRYYFKNRGKYARGTAYTMDGQYAAVNVFYTHNTFNKQISYFPNARDSSGMAEDAFGVRKSVLGLNGIIGFQHHLSKKIVVDFYTGIGVRFRYITDINRQFVPGRDAVSTSIDVNFATLFEQVDAEGGYSIAPNLSLGFRISYRL